MNELDTAQPNANGSARTLLLEVWEQPTVKGKWVATVKMAGCDETVPLTCPPQLLALLAAWKHSAETTSPYQQPTRSDVQQ